MSKSSKRNKSKSFGSGPKFVEIENPDGTKSIIKYVAQKGEHKKNRIRMKYERFKEKLLNERTDKT